MPNILTTNNIVMPQEVAKGIWKKAQSGSVLAVLAASEPMKFGNSKIMVFDTFPRAEFVGEGSNKGPASANFTPRATSPHKAHVTVRFDEEVKWADEDHQLGVLSELGDSISVALARALDLGAIHGINPSTGTTTTTIIEKLTDTTNEVESGDDAEIDLETAAGLVIDGGYTPNGIALDTAFAWDVATDRFPDGRKKFPDLGLGIDVTNLLGVPASVSSTIGGLPEVAAGTGVKALVGDFEAFRWGVQRDIGIQMIEFGNPDGQGDLKRMNQVALRAEVVYGWAFLDLAAFAKIVVPEPEEE
ncbi:MAG: phage major capsid protein [Coriobacteriales bacterium]|jgi:HK97 family phage major capsid protein|nr:phage major capsid protein [Coriobacteriales bacterium]